MVDALSVVHSDPEISGGIPVFRGTRVPVHALFDYLEGGETLDQFLDQFPSVSKQQAVAALDRRLAGRQPTSRPSASAVRST